jgi:hypothetical protein
LGQAVTAIRLQGGLVMAERPEREKDQEGKNPTVKQYRNGGRISKKNQTFFVSGVGRPFQGD